MYGLFFIVWNLYRFLEKERWRCERERRRERGIEGGGSYREKGEWERESVNYMYISNYLYMFCYNRVVIYCIRKIIWIIFYFIKYVGNIMN